MARQVWSEAPARPSRPPGELEPRACGLDAPRILAQQSRPAPFARRPRDGTGPRGPRALERRRARLARGRPTSSALQHVERLLRVLARRSQRTARSPSGASARSGGEPAATCLERRARRARRCPAPGVASAWRVRAAGRSAPDEPRVGRASECVRRRAVLAARVAELPERVRRLARAHARRRRAPRWRAATAGRLSAATARQGSRATRASRPARAGVPRARPWPRGPARTDRGAHGREHRPRRGDGPAGGPRPGDKARRAGPEGPARRACSPSDVGLLLVDRRRSSLTRGGRGILDRRIRRDAARAPGSASTSTRPARCRPAR